MARVRGLQQPAAEQLDALAQVPIDCVEGGTSVSFSNPLPLAMARAFGSVPGHALLPQGGLCATTFFCRELA